MAGEWLDISMRDYLADRGRTSGSVLGMVDREPEAYGRWLRGRDDDRPTAAKGRGSYFHARLLEPDTIGADFAFYPSRAEATRPVMIPKIGSKGEPLKTLVHNGEFVPQDGSPEGQRKSMSMKVKNGTEHAKMLRLQFLAKAVGKTIVYPEDQPLVHAMVRAVAAHPMAAELLSSGLQPEVTGRWVCPETGEPMRIRPDGIRPTERIWVEIKSVAPRGDERIDTEDSSAVDRWARDGWARKSALLHDGCREITGANWTGYWIVVEAREDEPRVSVVRDDCEADASMYALGVYGDGHRVHGYLDLIRKAQALRESSTFLPRCVRGTVPRWELSEYTMTNMRFLADSRGPTLTGASVVDNG